jgi:DNA-binding SARP family transcriptional activator
MVRLNLLRGFELLCDGDRVALPPSAQRLLAFVALHDRPVQRVYVAGALWLDASEQRSFASLRSALWRLRRPGYPLIEATPTQLGLADGVEVDLRRAIAASRRALREPAPDSALEDGDLAGDLLPDWYEDWVDDERERLRQLRLHALEAIGEQLLGVARHGQAVDACLLAIRMDPLRESTQRLLIRVYLAEGNWSEAVRQYRQYARRLREQLGVEPSDRMAALIAGDATVTR